MQERIDPVAYSTERLLQDIGKTAEMIGAPFCPLATYRALQVFEPEFSSCVVQLKAACKAGRFRSTRRRQADKRYCARKRSQHFMCGAQGAM